MITQQLQTESHGVQRAIYGVALSLDAFLLNGIQYGVLSQPVFDDFLQKAGGHLTRDLDCLEELAEQAFAAPSAIGDALAELRARCQQMIDLVAGLASFRTLPLDQMRLAVSRIAPLRADCVRLIEQLESGLRTRTPFYPSRPEHSTASVDAFLADLDRAFVEEWTASHSVDATA